MANETNKASWHKSNEHVALLLMTRPARTAQGRRVHAAVLARVEISMAIQEELSK